MSLLVDYVDGVRILIGVWSPVGREVNVAVISKNNADLLESDQVMFLSLDKLMRHLDH